MSSRDLIFSALKANKPTFVEHPEISLDEVISYKDLKEQFTETLVKIGGAVKRFSAIEEVNDLIAAEVVNNPIISTLSLSEEDKNLIRNKTSRELSTIEKVYLKGTLGVAENGCVWFDEEQMVNRVLPFISQHVIVVLEAHTLVATMHHAYEKIDVAETGFGSFIAGPSKTADIEQSLVIGAHGARSLTVYLVG